MLDKDDIDRRKCVRFPIALPLLCKINSSELEAKTHDLSAGGAGLEIDRDLPIDEPIDVSFELPNNAQKVFTKGKVVWSQKIDNNKYRVGVYINDKFYKPIPIVLRAINQNFGFATY